LRKAITEDGSRTTQASEEISRRPLSRIFIIRKRIAVLVSSLEISQSVPPNGSVPTLLRSSLLGDGRREGVSRSDAPSTNSKSRAFIRSTGSGRPASHWRWHRGNMSLLRWILAYLFDCVHPHTTWPHQNRFGHAYVCCLDCGREMPYSLEYMRIVKQDRKWSLLGSRPQATASLFAGVLLLLTASYAAADARTRTAVVSWFSEISQSVRQHGSTPGSLRNSRSVNPLRGVVTGMTLRQ
jgi:hypothetical protein